MDEMEAAILDEELVVDSSEVVTATDGSLLVLMAPEGSVLPEALVVLEFGTSGAR